MYENLHLENEFIGPDGRRYTAVDRIKGTCSDGTRMCAVSVLSGDVLHAALPYGDRARNFCGFSCRAHARPDGRLICWQPATPYPPDPNPL